MEMDCILKNFKVLVPIFKAKQKMYHRLHFLQKIDECLSSKLQGNVFGSIKGPG